MADYKVFLICVGVGICLGAFYGFLNLIKILLKKNIILDNILNFFYSLFFGFIILLIIVNYNFGEFRLYLILAFALGTILERKTIGKVFAKFYVWLYNKLCKVVCTLKKNKLVKKVLKWKMKKLLN